MAKKDNDEDDVYQFFTGFPLVSEAKQAVPVTKPNKGQALQVKKYDQLLLGRSVRAPLGFLASDVKTHLVEAPFKTYLQFIALTTYPIPHDSEELSKVYKPLRDIFLQQNPEYIARTLAENHIPMHEDCMTAVLMKHPITKEEDVGS